MSNGSHSPGPPSGQGGSSPPPPPPAPPGGQPPPPPPFAGYYSQGLLDLNLQVNWDTRGYTSWDAAPCRACENVCGQPIYPPRAGSYAATLEHYEQALGSLDVALALDGRVRHQEHRLLVIFKEPREAESRRTGVRYTGCRPDADTRLLQAPQRRACEPPPTSPREHRYFCLGRTAWRDLHLDEVLGPDPRWPDLATGRYYIRRYFGHCRCAGAWPYDAILAYFLWLFSPGRAYITNLAKCYFAVQGTLNDEIIERCMGISNSGAWSPRFLAREVELFEPTLVVSFTSAFTPGRQAALWRAAGREHQPPRVLGFPHPGGQVPPWHQPGGWDVQVHDQLDAAGFNNEARIWRRHCDELWL